ncbi:Cdc15p [Rhizophagus irregularis DAOM 197198w]|uniref:Cdc15p n=2 Tax=Rhizophagus irregularis (strain DAOM 197198w) TaxID=1432141 RepID=A0A015NFF5_RHIIW|nr:Cdc15p [Rhizophagus irregularis DAOM 197198w]
MSRNRKVYDAINRAYLVVTYSKYGDDDIFSKYEFKKHIIKRDNSLTEDEKTEAIKILTRSYDENKILTNEGIKRFCEGCSQKCLATSYCEHCVRNYLEAKFSNWTSGNNNIDNIIKECQRKTQVPSKITEWIPYDKLKDIDYLTRGGFSEIFTAIWVDGRFIEWDSEKQQLKRSGQHKVVLKKLENFKSANQRWFEEAKLHLTMSNKWNMFVQCFGLTQDPSDGNYMLHSTKFIIHRDLHSGNILYTTRFSICDLGFSGPADKPLGSIYGNLPYIAPEVIGGKQTTKASDIYSVAMLMWEILSGRPPFVEREHNYYLAKDIINGIRPKIVPGTPLEYEDLMKQCWDANPSKRPVKYVLWDKIYKINASYQNKFDKMDESLIQPAINEI